MWVYIKPLLIAAFIVLPVSIAAPFFVPIALLFSRWDEEMSYDERGRIHLRRGDLPRWASWFSTPDERLPGNPGEPGVYKALVDHDESICAWYWLGVRNRAHGLAFKWSKPFIMNEPWSATPGLHTERDPYGLLDGAPRMWFLRKPILGGRFHLKAGYRSYYVNKQWWGVPCLTITKS